MRGIVSGAGMSARRASNYRIARWRNNRRQRTECKLRLRITRRVCLRRGFAKLKIYNKLDEAHSSLSNTSVVRNSSLSNTSVARNSNTQVKHKNSKYLRVALLTGRQDKGRPRNTLMKHCCKHIHESAPCDALWRMHSK